MSLRIAVILTASIVVAALSATPASAANTWYASPSGSGNVCSQADPCSAEYALETHPVDGDTVVLAGGDYNVGNGISVSKRISVEGATTGAPTRLFEGGTMASSAFYYAGAANIPAHVTDIVGIIDNKYGSAIHINNRAPSADLVLDRLRGEADEYNTSGIFLWQFNPGSGMVLRNSIGRVARSNSWGITVAGAENGSSTVEIRNSVGDAPVGPFTNGIRVYTTQGIGECGSVTVNIKNVYARGGGPADDLYVRGILTCIGQLNSFNSNWRDRTVDAQGSFSSNSDQHSSPLFANPAGGDYHQLPGSPTIDAGVADSLIGSTDFDGEARTQGGAPDIGPDEFTVNAGAAKDSVAPLGGAMSFSPSSFVPIAGTPSSIARAKAKRKRGTTVSYRLSEPATVTFTVQRQRKGRKSGKKCSLKRKRGKRCTTYKVVKGSFSRAGNAGTNSFRFTGVLNRKALKPGRYRMIGLPKDLAGNTGAVFNGSFRVLSR